jgi:uncharacterized phage infection (PIP) family protein YhgE
MSEESVEPTSAQVDASHESRPEPVESTSAESATVAQAQPAVHSHDSAASAPAMPSAAVDQRAYAQYKALAQAVLESAEIASRAAEAAMSSGNDLRLASQHLREVTDAGHKKARLLLAVTAGFMLICLIFFLIMGVRLVSRVSQLDVAIEATAQKVAEMQVGLETLGKLSTGLGEMTIRQSELSKTQAEIEGRIDAALKQTEAMTQKVPTETAKQVASKSDAMMRQVQTVGSGLQAQSKAVQDLSKEVQSLKSGLGQVDGLKRDVQALITLQRERYLEVLQKNQAAARNNPDRVLQYPRPNPAEADKN